MPQESAARALFGVAALLESEGANPYRVRAYRRAALRLRNADNAGAYLDDAGLLRLPGLGPRLQRKLGELLTTGRMGFVDELWASLPPAKRDLLAIPGVGPKTAALLHGELRLRSAADVAAAAAAGRLRRLRGIGPRRELLLGQAAATVLARVS